MKRTGRQLIPGEQSLQIILLNERGLNQLFDFFAESLACFELDNF